MAVNEADLSVEDLDALKIGRIVLEKSREMGYDPSSFVASSVIRCGCHNVTTGKAVPYLLVVFGENEGSLNANVAFVKSGLSLKPR